MGNGKSANIRQVLTRRCSMLGIPISGTFELTARCNLQCKMCYVRLTPRQIATIGRELSTKEWLQLAQKAKQAGMVFLLLTGGEPTLRDDFCEIYETLAQMGFSISINTNGTLLTPSLRELWHKYPPSQVNVTLYGICREDYQSLCGNPDAFSAVMDSLTWLKSENILVHLNTTIVPANHEKWLELERLSQQLGQELRMTTYCFPPVRRGGCDTCSDFSRLPPSIAADLAVQDILYREGPDAICKLVEANSPVQSGCILDDDEGAPIRCSAGRSQFWITWNGRMTPCGMLDRPAVYPLFPNNTFSDCWEKLHAETAKIRLCPDCLICEYRDTCHNCAAVTYAETGRFDGKPEYMCQYSSAYQNSLSKIYAKLNRCK